MTKAMTEVKLKPYPFCGSEDFVLGFHEGHNEMRVKCKRCKTLFTIFDTPENAPKLWNRRTYCYQAEEDYYAVIIKAMSDETAQYYDDDLEGDYVTLYRATDFISKEV